MFCQRPRPGYVRPSEKAAVEVAIARKLRQLAEKHECSRSFVHNTILAKALGINLEETFYDLDKRSNQKTRKRTHRRTGK